MKQTEPGNIKCLGWCNQEFFSPDKKRLRFCKKCTSKKESVEKTTSSTRSLGGGLKISN